MECVGLRVSRGKALLIIGRKGVGKTSLLATAMGFTTLHRGLIRLHGADVSRQRPYRRAGAGLGYVPQEREIFPSLTLLENLEVAARPGPWSVATVFEMFPRLAERRRNRGDQLSGGEQQMLAIARALVGNPSVILMDEPTEGLAPVIVEELARSLRRLAEVDGLALILVEQNTPLAPEIAPPTVLLHPARVASPR